MSGIVLGQEGNSVDIARIVDGNNFNIVMLAVFIMSAKNVSADTAITIDCHTDSHKLAPEIVLNR